MQTTQSRLPHSRAELLNGHLLASLSPTCWGVRCTCLRLQRSACGKSTTIVRESHARIGIASSCYAVQLWMKTRKPGYGCNIALAGWWEAGCIVILSERQRVACRAKRPMWR